MKKNYLVVIEGDMNDADNKEKSHVMKGKDFLEFKGVVDKINSSSNDLWSDIYDNTEEIEALVGEENWDKVRDYLPLGGDYGCHSINSITVYEIAGKSKELI